LVARVSQSLISPPFLIKIKHPEKKEYLICGVKGKKDFWIYKYYVHFFCSPKRNEPKKKRPEMPTSAKTGACYTGLIGATVLAAVRTISGLPSRLRLYNFIK